MSKHIEAVADRSIEGILPSCLDDIIRLNRDKYQMRMGSNEEIQGLPLLVEAVGDRQMQAKNGEISEWRYVVIDVEGGGQSSFMIGYRHGSPLITSNVRSIDYNGNSGFVLTKNSLYRLGKQGDGEPDIHLLTHICASLWAWGAGESLGVPHVFY